jgi:Lon protease-like protein
MEEILLPLFPLEVVLLPEEPLSLHIFEERCKTIIGECLEAQTTGQGQAEFGVVLLKEGAVSSIGCTARIVNLTRKYEDGRMDILTVGKRRFEILLTNEEMAYLRGSVEFFDDEGPDTPGDQEAEFAITRFREVIRKLRHDDAMPVHISRPYRHLSFRLAASLPWELDFKQQLLARRDEPARLGLVVRAMKTLLNQIEIVQKTQTKAGGNGHARR